MNTINAINVLDGNQYLVTNETGNDQVSETDFDSVYQSETDELSLDDIFHKVSEEYGVDESLLKAVAQAESGFDTNAVSSCGAMGIMQLMPTTAASLGVEDPYDAEQSITGGAKMLAYLLDDYNGNVTLALAAYNAGSGSVSKYGGVPPYTETQNYISKINDILGGALSQDSTTISGSTATNLDGVSTDSAPDVSTKGTGTTSSQGTGQTSSSSELYAQMVNSGQISTNNGLLNYDDYEYILDTYKQTFEKLTESMETDQESDIQTDVSEITAETATDIVQEEEEELSYTSLNNYEDGDSILKYNANVANVAMLTNVSSYDGILRNSPQSLYEAQASVVSPVISKLLNS